MKYVALAIAVAVLFFSPALTRPAAAACIAPLGESGAAGNIFYNSSQKIFQYCNDTSWMNMGQPGTGSGGCATPTLAEGSMVYNADHRVLQGCAGNTHQAFGPVGGGSRWERVATGNNHSCAIKANGTLWCWGDDGDGQLGNGAGTNADQHSPMQESTSATNWASVATGDNHSCAIKTNGTLWCWGNDSDGQLGNGAGVTGATSPVQETTAATNWVSVTTGTAYTCAIKTDGSAWCWGGDFNGKLGNGAVLTADQHSPSAVTGGATWSAISAGEHFACGIRTDGSAWCWGDDTGGQLGNGATTGNQPDPVAVTGGATWSAISAGINQSCGIRTDNTAWCWGNGSNGRLGNGGTANQPDPVAVSGGSTWNDVRAGWGHTCGIKTDGTAWCWGAGDNGELGDGTNTATQTTPSAVTGGATWTTISPADTHTCAIKTDGTVWCWGNDDTGELGNGTATGNQNVPVQEVTNATNWASVKSGENHVCAVKTNGTLWCWGVDADGQLGNGAITGDRNAPTQESTAATNWASVATGFDHTCAIKTTGTLWCWGSDASGQLGNGATTGDQISPVQESTAATDWASVAAGTDYSCAVKTTGTLWCWGSDSDGQLGNGAGGSSSSPVQESTAATDWASVETGPFHTCAVKTTGTLWCWGMDVDGQLGNGAPTGDQISPVQESTAATNWVSVAAGDDHTCAVKTTGTLWCWGIDALGQLGNGAPTGDQISPMQESTSATDWLRIAAEDSQSCAIKTTGTLWCWGWYANGRLGAGHPLGSSPIKNAECPNPLRNQGVIVYNNDSDILQYCDGVGWVAVSGTAPDLVAVPDGLIGYWKFDETSGATTAADSSGNNRTGTLTNMAPASDWVAGHRGNALDFDGTNDYVSVTSAPALDNIEPVSACAWIYRRTTAVIVPIIMDKSSDGLNGFNMYLSSGSILSYYSNDGDYKELGSLNVNTWYHVCYTYSGAGAGTTAADIKLYLNGTELSPGAAALVNGTPSDDSLNNLTIGSGASNAYPFNGLIDEVRLYNRVLTPTEIQALAAQ